MPPAHDTFALPAIELPQRCRDGLGADAARQLCLRIGASAAFAPGDLIEVFIDERFATAVIIKPKQVGLPLVLNVSQAILNSGMVKLRYQVLRAGQYSHASPVTVVYAKLECPGARRCTRAKWRTSSCRRCAFRRR
ncbi:hypothetical protein [Pseudomonas sp. NPDC007930]|uniref:hypothetical protein n=1 Tax=Pseudomonas sp. NPDC007930 TaxID=3364417 RepID=UPI0036E59104